MEASLLKIKTGISNLELEINALDGGVKLAALRARKQALETKNEMHELRKHISEHVKTLPVKPTKNKIVFAEPTVQGAVEPVEHVPEPVVEPVTIPKAKLVLKKPKKKKQPV